MSSNSLQAKLQNLYAEMYSSSSSSSSKPRRAFAYESPFYHNSSSNGSSSQSGKRRQSGRLMMKDIPQFGNTSSKNKSLGRITTAERSSIDIGYDNSAKFQQKVALPSQMTKKIEKLNRELIGSQSFTGIRKQQPSYDRQEDKFNQLLSLLSDKPSKYSNDKSSDGKGCKLFNNQSSNRLERGYNESSRGIKQNLSQRYFNNQDDCIKSKLIMVTNAINNVKI